MNDKELEPGYYTDYEGTKPARIGDKVALCVPLKELPGNTPSADKDLADARLERAVRAALEAAAGVAGSKWPRGSAHTYASENADRYIALEDASEMIASTIRAIDPAQIVKEVNDE